MREVSYTTVLFDLDHTLFDSHTSEAKAFESTMQSVGVESTLDVFAVYDRLNRALWRDVESGSISPNEVKVRRFEQLLAEVGASGDPVEMGATFVRGLADNGELYDGAWQLLVGLAATCRLALVTNGIGSVQRGRLVRLGLDDVFEVVSISGELGWSKPNRAIFDYTLDAMGVSECESVVMIGDSLDSDIRGGINAGLDTIWYNPAEVASREDTISTHTVSDLGAVGQIVRSMRPG